MAALDCVRHVLASSDTAPARCAVSYTHLDVYKRQDLDGLAVFVAHGDLGLAVGTQIGQGTVVAHGGQALGQAACQVDVYKRQAPGS